MRFKHAGLIVGLFLALGISHASASAGLRITIDVSDQIMTVEPGGIFGVYQWRVSTAGRGYVTPKGTFRPYLLKTMHYSSKYDNAPMPHSIFFLGGYAIHATPHVRSLGRPASHGCVRLHPRDAAKLFQLVKAAGLRDTVIRIVP